MSTTADHALAAGSDALRRWRLRRYAAADLTLRFLTVASAWLVLVVLGAVIISLMVGAWPAFHTFGPGFITGRHWNPVTNLFGALPAIYGTLVTSFIAMLVGIPVSLGIAIFLTELCPVVLKRPIGIAVELLAGIPSIIYGVWGLFAFAPFMQEHVQPALERAFAGVPILSALFAGPSYGLGVLTAGLILSIMVLPYITAITRDVFETVPPVLKDAAYGMGCTTFEVVRKVVIPYTRAGMLGGIMLGLGRALGETMAVTFVIGNAHRISASVLAPGTTISASIANEFTEATSGLYSSSLIATGLLLFVITFIVLAVSRYMLFRLQRKAGA